MIIFYRNEEDDRFEFAAMVTPAPLRPLSRLWQDINGFVQNLVQRNLLNFGTLPNNSSIESERRHSATIGNFYASQLHNFSMYQNNLQMCELCEEW